MTVLVPPRVLGRYLFYAPLASGGMATVYLGRMAGPKGFSRIIAIKQLHAQFVDDHDFVAMFLDEAQLIGRIHHSNVVAPIDVVEADGDLCIVMEYVHGEALGRLMKLSRRDLMPLRIVSAVLVQSLLGLHAAHEVTDADGQPLAIVHRDVSPQNILVGEDGITRVVDFGIAKAANLAHVDNGKLKGKLGYMAPEQLLGGVIDRKCDVFSAGIILWEMLTGKKLFPSASPDEAVARMRTFTPRPPSSIVAGLDPELDAITLKALAVDPVERYATAHEMARALESFCPPAGAIDVAEWVTRLVGDTLKTRASWIQDLIGLDLSEWTQTYVMSTSVPPPPNPGPPGSAEAQPTVTKSGPPPSMAPADLRSIYSVAGVDASRTKSSSDAQGGTLSSRVVAGLVGLILVGTIAWAFLVQPRQRQGSARDTAGVAATRPVEPSPSTSQASVQSPVESQSTSAPEPSHVPLPAASAITAAAPNAAAPNAAAPNAAAPNAAATVSSGNVSQPKSAATGSHRDCRIPYVVDAKGIKRFRPECFR